ncbi:MAG: gliding motility-associated C-terminal domain-containing protein [Bacteroidales bacterium]|nr:gliding motility-associated C-terminal domain-containing protein [Bacteroidales bacterium]
MNRFENDIKNIVESYEPAYSEQAWDRLQKELPKGSFSSKYIYWGAAIFAVVALLISYFAYTSKPNAANNSNPNFVSNEKVLKTIAKPIALPTDEPTGNQIESQNVKNKPSINEIVSEHPIIESSEENVTVQSLIVSEEKIEDINTDDVSQINENSFNIHPQIVISNKQGCAPFTISAGAKGVDNTNRLEWLIDNQVISSGTSKINYIVEEGGEHELILRVYSSKLLVAETSCNVQIFNKPNSVISSSLDGDLLSVKPNTNYKSIMWSFEGIQTDEDSPVFEMIYTGDYQLSVQLTDINSCVVNEQKTIHYEVEHLIFAPNAFTPDNNGLNDGFILKYEPKTGYQYTLQIFDPAGKMLFESTNPNQAWDGKNVEESHIEKYTWRLIIKDPRGYVVIKEDTFSLLKR